MELDAMDDHELQALVDRARRILAERELGEKLLVQESISVNGMRYTKELRPCGKAKAGKCRKCRDGEYHGPYWYRHEWDDGQMKSKYLGKEETAPERDPDLRAGLEMQDRLRDPVFQETWREMQQRISDPEFLEFMQRAKREIGDPEVQRARREMQQRISDPEYQNMIARLRRERFR